MSTAIKLNLESTIYNFHGPVEHEPDIRLIDLVITLIGLKQRKAPIIKCEPFSKALIVKII